MKQDAAPNAPPQTRRGNKSPTSVWIQKKRLKKGTSYAIRWVDPVTGKQRQQSCGRDQAYARSIRAQKERDLREGLSGLPNDKTIGNLLDAIDGFMAGKAPYTIQCTKWSLEKLIDLCGDRLLVRVDRAMIMDFRAKRLKAELAAATVNKDLRQLKSALSYAVDVGWMASNPLLRWRDLFVKESEKVIRVVEPEEFDRIRRACLEPAYRTMLIVAYELGLRRGELVNLRWSAIDFERRTLLVVNVPEAGEFTKSRKTRAVPMTTPVEKALSELVEDVSKVLDRGEYRPRYPHCFTWPDGRQFTRDWVSREFGRLMKAAEVDRCTLHDLRRSFATLAQRAGVDKVTVKDLGGWSDVSVVERYYSGQILEAQRRAMDQLEAARALAG
jgi:integrase